MKSRIPFFIASAVLIIGVGIEVFMVLAMNNGTLTYTLDDAYIHLAVAENIAQGHYGINTDEFSSPSSSILWPFLLAPFAQYRGAVWVLFLFNVFVAIVVLYIVWKILDHYFQPFKSTVPLITVLLVLLIPATGIIGLIFTGMEHLLQICFTVLIFYSLVNELHGKYNFQLMFVSIVVSSLIRYENLSFCLFGIAFLYARGKKKDALLTFGSMALLHTLFALFLYFHQSSFLPTSIMVKRNFLHRDIFPLTHLLETLQTDFGLLYGSFTIFFIFCSFLSRTFDKRLLSMGTTFVLLLHLLYGNTQNYGSLATVRGYFFRYEMYVWTVVLLTSIIISKDVLRQHFQRIPIITVLVFLLIEMTLCARNNIVLLTIPNASNNIYEQHFQMHRFVAHFYKKNVAVNDIGYVSYNNDDYVLDLWGLASKEVWKLRTSFPGKTDWIDSVMHAKNISLAILYDSWFPILPASFTKVAELSLTKETITASEHIVSFYAVEQSEVEEIKSALTEFKNTLPDNNMLVFVSTSNAGFYSTNHKLNSGM